MKKTIAIITGATGGLGKAFTKHLITDVDEVWAIGRNLEGSLGEKIKGYSVDVEA